MRYDRQAQKDLRDKFSDISRIHDQLMLRLFRLDSRIHEPKAKEYLLQGVGRRLGILNRCIQNIFTLFPVNRRKPLPSRRLTDVEINLHAFFVNVAGLFDNMAWVFVIEEKLLGKLGRHEIGLFNTKTQRHFPGNVRAYFCSDRIKNWYSTYSKNYRDALAHRIPMYVPPAALAAKEQARYRAIEQQLRKLDLRTPKDSSEHDELRAKQQRLGTPSFVFIHSYNEAPGAIIHQQIIIDYVTAEEALNVFCDGVWPDSGMPPIGTLRSS
jgi:hypothetical protein